MLQRICRAVLAGGAFTLIVVGILGAPAANGKRRAPANARHSRRGVVLFTSELGIAPFFIESDGRLTPRKLAFLPYAGQLEMCRVRSCLYVVVYRTVRHWMMPTTTSTIFVYKIDRRGSLSMPRPGGTKLPRNVGSLVADPKGRFLFAFCDEGAIIAYRLRPNGSLGAARTTMIYDGTFSECLTSDGEPLVGATDDGDMVIEPSGRYAYITHSTGFVDHSEMSISEYRIAPNGALADSTCVKRDTNEPYHWSLPDNSKSMRMLQAARNILNHPPLIQAAEYPNAAAIDEQRRLQ